MKIGKMRFVPVRNAPGIYDIYFCLLSDKNPGYKGFTCEYNNFRIIHASDHNALRMMITAYERISTYPLTQFEFAPRALFAGVKAELFASLPDLEFFIQYHK